LFVFVGIVVLAGVVTWLVHARRPHFAPSFWYVVVVAIAIGALGVAFWALRRLLRRFNRALEPSDKDREGDRR
jgi:uncharacterized membrane protein